MQLYKIRGGTLEELQTNRYNIGIGISLGNKWFTKQNILELVRWALPKTRKEVIIYVADSIPSINLEIRKRISIQKASILADSLGTKTLENIKTYLEEQLSLNELSQIKYAKWQALVDDDYKAKVAYLYSLYGKDELFTETIYQIVKGFTQAEQRNFTQPDIYRLGTYLIEELPELLNRVKINSIECDATAYPFDGEITRLVENIQLGYRFPEIRKKILDTKPKVFLEVR